MTHKERAHKYIEAMPEAVSGAGGHTATFKVACILWNGFRLEHEDVMDLLREYNRRCDPPWSEKELQHKAKEAARVKHDHFRGHLLVDERDIQPRSTRRPAIVGAGEVLKPFRPLPEETPTPSGLCPRCWRKRVAAPAGGPTCPHHEYAWPAFSREQIATESEGRD